VHCLESPPNEGGLQSYSTPQQVHRERPRLYRYHQRRKQPFPSPKRQDLITHRACSTLRIVPGRRSRLLHHVDRTMAKRHTAPIPKLLMSFDRLARLDLRQHKRSQHAQLVREGQRPYRNSIASNRTNFRTTLLETCSSRQIILIGFFWTNAGSSQPSPIPASQAMPHTDHGRHV
jgi:hypothetical protein